MIDLNLLRKETQTVKRLILKKDPKFNVDTLVDLDQKVRNLKTEIENLRKEKNDLAQKGAGGITDAIRKQSIEIGKSLKEKEEELITVEKDFKNLYLSCPNLPQEDIPDGNKESNKVVKTVSQKPEFKFKPKNHMQLNEKLNWFDFDAAAKMSGSNFVLYKGDGVKLIYALTNLMMKNNTKYGFEAVLPPYLVVDQALINSGNLPKFKGDFYNIEQDGLNLIPTAEVSLTNLYAGKTFNEKELPVKMFSWTSCFRREAG
ncbi:MAG: aminoacyl--tRNA ligase-related protein, partial [bacterium]